MLKQILDKRRRILVYGLTLLICILTILLIVLPDGTVIPKEALELFRAGEYSQAAAFCEEKDFGKLSGFTILCDAFREDTEGKCRDAKESLEQWDKLQKNQRFALPGDIQNQIVVLRRKIEKDCLELLAKEREENRRKQIWIESSSAFSAEVPYMGMSESYIGKTDLGAPSRSEFLDNKFGEGKLGYYFWDQGGKVIFVARTENGKVSSVTDKRNKKKSSATPVPNDPYNVYDYSNEEDFYDEHRDDFMNYEEAEEYWRDHQK